MEGACYLYNVSVCQCILVEMCAHCIYQAKRGVAKVCSDVFKWLAWLYYSVIWMFNGLTHHALYPSWNIYLKVHESLCCTAHSWSRCSTSMQRPLLAHWLQNKVDIVHTLRNTCEKDPPNKGDTSLSRTLGSVPCYYCTPLNKGDVCPIQLWRTLLIIQMIIEGVRVRVGQPSIYNSCRFSFKYVLNVLIEQKPARVVYWGLAHSGSDPFNYTGRVVCKLSLHFPFSFLTPVCQSGCWVYGGRGLAVLVYWWWGTVYSVKEWWR